MPPLRFVWFQYARSAPWGTPWRVSNARRGRPGACDSQNNGVWVTPPVAQPDGFEGLGALTSAAWLSPRVWSYFFMRKRRSVSGPDRLTSVASSLTLKAVVELE
jgi:hypothetical protein